MGGQSAGTGAGLRLRMGRRLRRGGRRCGRAVIARDSGGDRPIVPTTSHRAAPVEFAVDFFITDAVLVDAYRSECSRGCWLKSVARGNIRCSRASCVKGRLGHWRTKPSHARGTFVPGKSRLLVATTRCGAGVGLVGPRVAMLWVDDGLSVEHDLAVGRRGPTGRRRLVDRRQARSRTTVHWRLRLLLSGGIERP